MKLCFNLIPPVNKMIALLVCILLIIIYTRSKANNSINDNNSIAKSFKKTLNDRIKAEINTVLHK